MKKVCVYCGSRLSPDPQFRQLAEQTGKEIAKRNWGVVYGGGRVGMMGKLANAALAEKGYVFGVIPTALKTEEVAHNGLTKLHETPDMHSRKALMETLSDAFLVLPGGFGTLDEFFEILTWRQLGIHNKPILVLNLDGYFDGLVQFTQKALEQDFVKENNLSLFEVKSNLDDVFEMLEELLGLED